MDVCPYPSQTRYADAGELFLRGAMSGVGETTKSLYDQHRGKSKIRVLVRAPRKFAGNHSHGIGAAAPILRRVPTK
jgi:hypothetical protein